MFQVHIGLKKCNKVILEKGGMLMFIPGYCNKKTCVKAVDYCSYALEFLIACIHAFKKIKKLSKLVQTPSLQQDQSNQYLSCIPTEV